MLAQIVDGMLALAARCGFRLLHSAVFIPVLHIERLYQDASFQHALAFAREYQALTGERPLYTVITPASRQLQAELVSAGFDEAHYARRIATLTQHCDIGVHGHFLRESGTGHYPVHAYWDETRVVHDQLREECEWLESRGLMQRRVYSAGWWYIDTKVMNALRELDFQFDFSCSTVDYNRSPLAHRRLVASSDPGMFSHGRNVGPISVWAVAGLGGSGRYSAVPRRVLRAFGLHAAGRAPRVVSLYSHDWDLDVSAAMRSVQELSSHGAHFVSLDALVHIEPIALPHH